MIETASNESTAVLEDGPASPTPAQAPAPQSEVAASPKAASELPATESPKQSPEDIAYDRLAAKASQQRTESAGTSPSTANDPKNANPAAATGAQDEAFASLAPDSLQALKRTGWQPTPEQWAGMPPLARANLVKEAKQELSRRDREYQQSKQQGSQNESVDPATVAEPDFGVAQQQQGTQQRQPSMPNPEAIVGQLEQAYQSLGSTYGDEFVAPIRQVQDTFGQIVALALTRQQQAYEQKFQQLERRLGEAHGGWQSYRQKAERDEVDAGWKQVESEFKQVEEVKSKAFRDELTRQAKALHRSHQELPDGGNYSLSQAMVDAARGKLFPKIQQLTQQQLRDHKSKSLRGTPDRGGAVRTPTKSVRAMSQDEREDYAHDLLADGKTKEEVFAILRG
jgi:hypothetical protein